MVQPFLRNAFTPRMRAASLLFAMSVSATATAAAQDRLPAVPVEQQTPAQRRAIEEFKAIRQGEVFGPFVPLLRSPELMVRASALGEYLRFRSALPARLSEFIILLTARRWTQQYEWNAHARLAAEAGLAAETIAAIAEGRPPALQPDEAALSALLDELHRTQQVGDATYARAVAAVGEQGVVDALGITGYYTMLALVMNTARTPLPAGVAPPLKPLGR